MYDFSRLYYLKMVPEGNLLRLTVAVCFEEMGALER